MSSVERQSAGTRIQCSTCQSPLPLCEAAGEKGVRVWLCSRCGKEFRAMLAPEYSIDELRGIRPERVNFDLQPIFPVATEMLAFARQLNTRRDTNVEKRSATRHALIATLKAVEFDAQLRQVGRPFHTICRNLSTGGISLIHDRAIRSEFLVLELSTAAGDAIQTLAHVRRRLPLGRYHDIGSAFVTKLAAPSPETSPVP